MAVETQTPLTTVYQGWDVFQRNLAKSVAPLTAEQLAMPVAPGHWAIGTHIQHIPTTRQELIVHVLRHGFHLGGELAACLGAHHLPSIWG